MSLSTRVQTELLSDKNSKRGSEEKSALETQADEAKAGPSEGEKASPVAQASSSTDKLLNKRGLSFSRVFTQPGEDPYEQVEWTHRDSVIADGKGGVVFEQRGVEVPTHWSVMATNVVASKYFRGTVGAPDRESSVRQLVSRVVDTICAFGRREKIFCRESDAQCFHDELVHLLLEQKMAFNSPVWFNVGVEEKPQCSACFINSVEDSMESILGLARTEGMLFKFGSGAGSNLSSIRSSRELLAGGGEASGPVSFMRGYDAFAGVIKSGGKTRRAAKMVILDAEHPDISEFIRSKAHEEKKAWALIDAGYDGSFNGEAYESVFFQNANHSVRATDEFMHAVLSNGEWTTKAVVNGDPVEVLRAKALMNELSEAAWTCGDPGMQFHTTINRWHTCKQSGEIRASNPCSEYMFLDDSACNLASLNLAKFRREDGEFDVESFERAVELTTTAMEVIVSNASYPSEKIRENSEAYRPLGLGYANLGALLMARGLPYDSMEGRAYAASITALMTGRAYARSCELAKVKGPFAAFVENKDSVMGVMGLHRAHIEMIEGKESLPEELLLAARHAWNEVTEGGGLHGLRNAQATVLAPTGTIGFMMDCDTTGIEPDISLVKHKKLVGGGLLKYVNRTVPEALSRLGYSQDQVTQICDHLDEEGTIEGAPGLRSDHLPVFDCAFAAPGGERSIHWKGHVKMMAAVQPFLSGAISKTVNMSHDTTPKEMEEAYIEAWRLGLKSIALYRDGCKRTQPLSSGKVDKQSSKEPMTESQKRVDGRKRLSDERRALTHKFAVGGHEGYITVGLYDDGQPGEVFVTMSKVGSTISGLMDAFATSVSMALQYGVPLKVLVDKFSHTRFEPSGFTGNPEIPMAKSITDYLFRWMALKFMSPEEARAAGAGVSMMNLELPFAAEDAGSPPAENLASWPLESRGAATGAKLDESLSPPLSAREESAQAREESSPRKSTTTGSEGQGSRRGPFELPSSLYQADAPPCSGCGSIMVRNGACYKCFNCGSTSGCS